MKNISDMAELVQKDHGSATGGVVIREWNLFGRASAEGFRKPLAPGIINDAVVLVGPVVGTVTETTGRQVKSKGRRPWKTPLFLENPRRRHF